MINYLVPFGIQVEGTIRISFVRFMTLLYARKPIPTYNEYGKRKIYDELQTHDSG
jgi:hypothetical protein